ncbi:MAG TPA: hypothetical protein VLM91_19375 [Candidatus Methylomirabilis sp.]|nr:hypothetical protein [Candidatus Methylomirabilis sp.]
MEKNQQRRWPGVASIAKTVFWLLLIGLVVQQVWRPYRMEAARTKTLEQLQNQRKSRVIAMIHRQDTLSLFGIPVSRYINIEDSEAILRAIRLTPPDQPIDLILHTPGGLVLAAEQIARALVDRTGPVTVFVPHYAMSGGSLIALAADRIVMDPNAVLGPVDPQIEGLPAASILKAVATKRPALVSDRTLILADIAAKARLQVAAFAAEILQKHFPKDKAAALALVLSEGRWTHDFPITVPAARELGLSVTTEMPRLVYNLMDLYPQGPMARPSVMYVPLRPPPATHEGAPHLSPAGLPGGK